MVRFLWFSSFDRFVRICRNLSHYYSGSSKKKSLYRVKYILRLSCVKSLVRKHKSTVRAFLKRLGSELLEEFLMEEEHVLALLFPRASSTSRRFYLYRGRIWYLDIFCINDLVNYQWLVTRLCHFEMIPKQSIDNKKIHSFVLNVHTIRIIK